MPNGHFWNEIEGAPLETVVEVQNKRLHEHLPYIYHNAPFFRRKIEATGVSLDAFRHVEDLARISLTTKEEIRSSMDEAPPLGAHQAAPTSSLVRYSSSSGTTGRPVYHAYTERDMTYIWDAWIRGYYATGIRPGDCGIFLYAMSGCFAVMSGFEALQHMGCGVIPAGGERGSEKILRLIKDLRPNVLLTAPSHAVYLAEKCKEIIGVEARELGVGKLSLGGEPIVGMRQQLVESWGAEFAREYMGAAELCLIWGECQEEKGMHLTVPDQVFVELIDSETLNVLPWKEGNTGELVYTTLVRQGCPVIRYRSRDVVTVTAMGCACGRTGPLIRCHGRSDDMLRVKGINLFPSALNDLLEEFRPDLTGEFRIVLGRAESPKALTGLTIKTETVLPSGPASDALIERVTNAIHNRLNIRTTVIPVRTGDLGRDYRSGGLPRRELFEYID
jgi:phenylacetate-CoA ligase